MEEIFKDLKEKGIGSHTLDAYLSKMRTAIDEAYNAGEHDLDYVAMEKIGEAKVYMDAIEVVWHELNS